MEQPSRAFCVAVLIFSIGLVANPAQAQSITAGVLHGTVREVDGSGVAGAVVSLEGAGGAVIRSLQTASDGSFRLTLLQPGTYALLVEQAGYQPIRYRAVVVQGGRMTAIGITLERRPPPITAPTEVAGGGAINGVGGSRLFSGRELTQFDRRRDVTDLLRSASEVVSPGDGRSGFAIAAGGLPPVRSRLVVDGIEDLLLRHPGLGSEPASAPLYGRDGLSQAALLGQGLDVEWARAGGSLLSAQTAAGGNRLTFAPYAGVSSSKLGGRSLDNPADSSATSFQVGAVLSGALRPDTAHFLLRADYQSLEQPSAAPWEHDTAAYRGGAVALAETIGKIVTDSYHTTTAGLAPALRTWKGGSGLGRFDWQLSQSSGIMIRTAYANWTERAPLLAEDRIGGAGSQLKARDLSAALVLTTAVERWSNEFRAGFVSGRRDWAAPGGAALYLAFEGVGVGTAPAVPARFDQRVLSVSDAVQFSLGDQHQIKLGGAAALTSFEHRYSFGTAGIYSFGDLDQFGGRHGDWFQASDNAEAAKFSTTDLSGFVQDTWDASPELQVLLGVRYDKAVLPKHKISVNDAWGLATNRLNAIDPKDSRGISPRLGFVWNVRGRGEWLLSGGASMGQERLDPAAFAEAMIGDGGLTVRRAQGSLASLTAVPAGAEPAHARLTYFDLGYRSPRTLKGEVGVTRTLGGSTTFSVTGGYHHTDYLLRRVDLNRIPDPSGSLSDGRALYGALVQQGGLVSAALGSNRRFTDFDMVSVLVPNGYSDYYAVTASLERRVHESLSLIASYTYSRTRDNTLGLRSPDPADQLSPFPALLNGTDWTVGRSDFDIPHRVAATVEYRSRGRMPVTVGVRGRYRSGLPFTPGFGPGVDMNGDGSTGNDPAALDAAVGGLSAALAAGRCAGATGGIAERNSCREASVGTLDLHLAIGLPVTGPGRTLQLTLDGFNVAATATGLTDRALLLVDPSKSISTSATGVTTVPFVINPRFGTLLARRGEPRIVRVGLRMEY